MVIIIIQDNLENIIYLKKVMSRAKISYKS